MPLTTSPVFTPTRKASSMSQRLPTSAATSLMAVCMLNLHRTARSASSSCATGTPKQRQDGITGVLLDAASKLPYFLAHASKVPSLDFTHVLRVQLFRQRSKPGQVAEENCDQAALELAKSRWWFCGLLGRG